MAKISGAGATPQQLQAMQQELANASKKADQAENDARVLRDEIAKLQKNQTEGLNSERKTTEGENTKIESAIDKLAKSQTDGLQAERKTTQNENSKIESRLTKLEKRVAALEKKK